MSNCVEGRRGEKFSQSGVLCWSSHARTCGLAAGEEGHLPLAGSAGIQRAVCTSCQLSAAFLMREQVTFNGWTRLPGDAK